MILGFFLFCSSDICCLQTKTRTKAKNQKNSGEKKTCMRAQNRRDFGERKAFNTKSIMQGAQGFLYKQSHC